MKKVLKRSLIVLSLVVGVIGLGGCTKKAEDRAEEDIKWQFISADDMKATIEANDSYQIIDIQPEKDFAKGHLPDSVGVAAYPVDTVELEKKVTDVVSDFSTGEDPIYVMCPGGGSGAKRTISLMQENGIDAKRLFIVENGAKGWPHKDLWVTD